jgi:HTH-type transcriptional regulator/antitoxin HipB
MLVRTPSDLGALIRDQRKQLGLDQSALAKRIGVSRQWVIGVEQGHARAALGLVLRAIDALDIRLQASVEKKSPRGQSASAVDINAIVAKAKKRVR